MNSGISDSQLIPFESSGHSLLLEETAKFNTELINNLFRHPYTKIEFIQKDLKVSRVTAAAYLNRLADDALLTKMKLGVGNYYVNLLLVALFANL
jgi:hypothetical protein